MSDDDAPVWELIEETGKPISIHIGLTDRLPSARMSVRGLPGTGHFYDAPRRMLEWAFSGVLDRHQSLKIILAEVDCGWMPYFAEQADDNYLRHSFSDLKDVKLRLLPSEYMSRVLLPDLHHRPLRDREPRAGRGRPDDVVERLPPHHLGLAVLVEDDQRLLRGCPS